ncbi:MAG: AsmA-like C-terminal region-containing protein [Bacteroidota bacterium]
MKKVFIIIGSFIVLLLLAAVLTPIIFKDDIRAAIDKEIKASLNANVYYNTEAFGVSLFKDFPNITASVGDFGIAGVDQFEGDTLLDVKSFEITLDIMSVISGDKINIVSVKLDQPDIQVYVMEDGSANYDIVKDTGEDQPAEEESAETGKPLDIGIQEWVINDANILYNDLTIPFYIVLVGLNHEGSGDFSQEVFDMITTTNVDQMYLGYDGDEYITNKSLSADITMAMDLANMKFTFKENKVSLNDFGFGFEGYVSMPAEDIDMDIKYAGKDINLRSIISLIPGVYLEYLDGITASGSVGFDGYVSGTYSENSMPKVAANFSVNNGKISYADYPIPMEQIMISAAFNYPSADLRESSFIVDNFSMTLDGEKLTSSLIFRDFEDYYWDFKLNGGVDLEKVTKIIPLEGMELKGKITAALNTSGRMSDLDAERYEKLPASGSMSISGFNFYSAEDLPQGFGISEANMTFNPKEVALTKFKGNAGRTDLNMDGSITNHLQYILGDSTKLYGKLNFSSALVDVNEWMLESDSAVTETTSADSAAMELIRIPEDIDFVLASNINQILYDDLTLKDFKGKLIIRDGAMTMEKVNFNLLDGYFEMNGLYNSASNLEKPTFNFDLQIKELSIASAFKSFTTVQKLAPVAEKMAGKFSTNFNVGGTLGEDMMPIYEDMVGAGLVNIAQASLSNVKVLSAVSSVTKLNQDDGQVTIKDIIMSTEIKGGRLHVQPFDIKFGGRSATVSGSTGLDGSLQYAMMMNVPSGQIGESLNSTISSLTGMNNLVSNSLDLTLGITGGYNDPKVKLLSAKPAGSGGSDASLKSALKTQATDEIAKQKEVVTQKVEAAKDSAKVVVDQKVTEVKEEAKEKIDETKQEVEDKAKDAVKNLFKRK